MSKEFGQNLKLCRQKKGLYQEDLAQELGMNKTSVSSWESGRTEPAFEIVVALCDILEIAPNQLFGFADRPRDLSPNEQRALNCFNTLPERVQYRALGYLEALSSEFSIEEDIKNAR